MILTQKMIDKLSVWSEKDENNHFAACFLPPEFTEKYMPDELDDRLYKPITKINVLAQMVGVEEFFITITHKSWLAEVESEKDNFDLLIILAKEKYYSEKLAESVLEKVKIMQGVA